MKILNKRRSVGFGGVLVLTMLVFAVFAAWQTSAQTSEEKKPCAKF